MHIYGHGDYLAEIRPPVSLEDVDNHRIVSYGVPIPTYLRDVNWLEAAGRAADDPRLPVLRINNIFSIKIAVMRGIGIAVLPDYMVEPESGWNGSSPRLRCQLCGLFRLPGRTQELCPVHVFRDFLLAKAQNWPY